MTEVSSLELGAALFFLVWGPTIAAAAIVTLVRGWLQVRRALRTLPDARTINARQLADGLMRGGR